MPYKYKDFEKRLLLLGFKIVRQNDSHVIFSKNNLTFPVPKHWWKDISFWVERKILKILWISNEEFRKIK